MAIEAARLSVVVDADTDAAVRGLQQVDTSIDKTARSGEQAGSRFRSAFDGMTGSLIPFELGMAGAGVAAVTMARSVINAASDMEESMSKVEVVFGSSADAVKDFADDAAENLGLSEEAALAATGTFGNLFTSMGLGRDVAADMSIGIAQLAADLGSFNNIGTDEALEKIRAGLVGEVEPLRSLGVNLNAADIAARAMAMGLAESEKQLTAADKAQASYALILEQTTNAQGDFARTSDGLANSTKTMQGNFQDLQATIGKAVLPVATDFVGALNDVMEGATVLTGILPKLSEALIGNEDAFSRASEAAKTYSDRIRDNGYALAEWGVDIAVGPAKWIWGIKEATDGSAEGFFDWARKVRDAATAAEELRDPLSQIEMLLAARDKPQAGGSSNTAQKQYNDMLARQAELAGVANERNMEYFHTIELGSGAAAEAAFNLAKINEAAASGIQGFTNLNTAFDNATGVIGGYEQSIGNAESALEILKGEQEENGSLTAEQQRQYDTLTWAIGRYQGGIEDSEGAVVDAAVAHAEYTRKLDELNGQLANGEISASDYAREMAGITAETDPATSSAYNLAGAQGDLQLAIEGVVNKLGNLLIDLGLLPESKRTEFQTPGMEDAKQNVDQLKSKMGEVPESMVITAYVDILQAQNALNELRGMTFTQSPPKEGPMAFVPDWSYLFEGMVKDAEDYGKQAMERLRSHLRSIDLDSILSDQTDLNRDIARITALRDAMLQIGDTESVEALNAELAQLQVEAANLAGIIETDAVQAWIANEDAAKAAAEAAEAAIKRQEELARMTADAARTAVMVLAEGGNAASSYFDRIVSDYEAASAAVKMGRLLGLPPEAMAELVSDLAEAETVMSEGTQRLTDALLRGALDEETLAALAAAGGEWFRALYDKLFGEDALAELEDGWNDVDDLTLDRLADLIGSMEDGGEQLMEPLIDAVLSGAVSFDEALGLLGEATGKQVDAMVVTLERLEQQLMVDLAEALLAGTDPSGIEQNIDIIRRLLDELSGAAEYTGRVVSNAITGDGAGTAFSGSGGYSSSKSSDGSGGGPTGIILSKRTTAKFDAEIEALRAEMLATSDMDARVRAAINMKILMENRDAQIAAHDANKDGQVTRDELGGGDAGKISDAILDGYRRVITGSRRNTSRMGV